MIRRISIITFSLFAIALLWTAPATAQSNAEAEAAARDLVIAMRADQQVNNVFPVIMQQLRPLVTGGRAAATRDFDALMPVAVTLMNDRTAEFVAAVAAAYARHFSAAELRQIATFYGSPAGQKMLDQMPALVQESAAIGQKFGQSIAADLQKRMTEELKKRGHH